MHSHALTHTHTRILQHAPHTSANPFMSTRAHGVELVAHKCAHQLRAGLGGGAHKVPCPLSCCLIPRGTATRHPKGPSPKGWALTWLWVAESQGDIVSQASQRHAHAPCLSLRRSPGEAQTQQSKPPHLAGCAGGGQGSAFTPVMRTRGEEIHELSWYNFHST